MSREAIQPLDFHGRHGRSFQGWKLREAQEYTRRLALLHYENFPVASLLVKRELRQDYCNVYAFCRWADDLGDETGDPGRSLELLAWWRRLLLSINDKPPHHPVFVALSDTLRRHRLPLQLFADLLDAFVQDQSKTTYAEYSELLGYCRLSANPVGRIVLLMHGQTDSRMAAQSDDICSALQLANHWQDVRRDWHIGRVYVPDTIMREHGYSRRQLAADMTRGHASSEFRATLEHLTAQAASLFKRGSPLSLSLRGRLGLEVGLFVQAGLAVLEKIRAQGFDTITNRPVIGWPDRLRVVGRAIAAKAFGGKAVHREASDAIP